MRGRKTAKTLFLAILASVCFFSACGGQSSAASSSETHTHNFVKLSARKATCTKEGRLAYWHCEDCGKYYLDAKATQEVTLDETVVAKLPHTATKTEGTPATCVKGGKMDSWTCSECNHIFTDEACTVQVDASQLNIPAIAHNLQHVPAIPVSGTENGVKEHWVCADCDGYFLDEKGSETITVEDTIDYYVMNVPDFVVEIPTGRDPIILQLSDTQIIDAGQSRPGRDGIDPAFWATHQIESRCYNYLTEIIEATNPDLIIMTGDLVYGEFDDNGTVWTSLVNFMDSFEIPWAPIFGNHDNESKMGVDWQCAQLEKAEYCLFDQKEVTGNGNYSVGIAQGGRLTRVFYMLDTNGCNGVSDESLENGHTVRTIGLKQDQVDWYTKQITILHEVSPETKISFAYHIQLAAFADACAQYGFEVGSEEKNTINIDRLPNKAEGDFGIIGERIRIDWDTSNRIYEGMKALGADSMFVGHEHCNSASIMYDGVRFQFGQKSSQYDSYNVVDANGVVSRVFGRPGAGTKSLIGGSVVVLSEADGAIKDAYIYYCGEENGELDWSKFH